MTTLALYLAWQIARLQDATPVPGTDDVIARLVALLIQILIDILANLGQLVPVL